MQLHILLLSTFLCIGVQQAYAQFPVSGTLTPVSTATTCGIQYTYDNAGNRIKREYRCITTKPGVSFTKMARLAETAEDITATVCPNPSTGTFSVQFSSVLSSAIIVVTDIQGRRIISKEIQGAANHADLDISQQAPGMYIVTVKYSDKTEQFKLTKL